MRCADCGGPLDWPYAFRCQQCRRERRRKWGSMVEILWDGTTRLPMIVSERITLEGREFEADETCYIEPGTTAAMLAEDLRFDELVDGKYVHPTLAKRIYRIVHDVEKARAVEAMIAREYVAPGMALTPRDACIEIEHLLITPPLDADGKLIPLVGAEVVIPEFRVIVRTSEGPLALLFEPKTRRWRKAPEA